MDSVEHIISLLVVCLALVVYNPERCPECVCTPCTPPPPPPPPVECTPCEYNLPVVPLNRKVFDHLSTVSTEAAQVNGPKLGLGLRIYRHYDELDRTLTSYTERINEWFAPVSIELKSGQKNVAIIDSLPDDTQNAIRGMKVAAQEVRNGVVEARAKLAGHYGQLQASITGAALARAAINQWALDCARKLEGLAAHEKNPESPSHRATLWHAFSTEFDRLPQAISTMEHQLGHMVSALASVETGIIVTETALKDMGVHADEFQRKIAALNPDTLKSGLFDKIMARLGFPDTKTMKDMMHREGVSLRERSLMYVEEMKNDAAKARTQCDALTSELQSMNDAVKAYRDGVHYGIIDNHAPTSALEMQKLLQSNDVGHMDQIGYFAGIVQVVASANRAGAGRQILLWESQIEKQVQRR